MIDRRRHKENQILHELPLQGLRGLVIQDLSNELLIPLGGVWGLGKVSPDWL